MDRDYPPLSSTCVRNLVDKFFEKRKLGASEIERITKEFANQDKSGEIVRLIGYFSQDFVLSPNPHTRKGGLLGLASVAIGLHEVTEKYYKSIIGPVLRSFNDGDSRVRYYACETLYNVMKNSRKDTVRVLREVFDAISRGVADSDLNVRQGAMQCDRLLKEIVTDPDKLDHRLIVSLLRERIYSNNAYTRRFIVSWISTLYAVPGLRVNTYLSQLLDGLFRILGDSNQDIRRQCELLLSDLLNEIVTNPKDLVLGDLINTLIAHCRLSTGACILTDGTIPPGSPRDSPSKGGSAHTAIVMDTSNQSAVLNTNLSGAVSLLTGEHLQQRTALTWIKTFVELDPEHMLPFASGIIGAVLPCFVESTETLRSHRATLETVVHINELLLNYASNCDTLNRSSSNVKSHVDSKLSNGGRKHGCENPLNMDGTEPIDDPPSIKNLNIDPTRSQLLDVNSVLDASCRLLEHQGILTRLSALRWVEVLCKVRPKELLTHIVRLFPLMLKLLADPYEGIVHSVIRLIGNLCTHPETFKFLNQSDSTKLEISADLIDALYGPSQSLGSAEIGTDAATKSGTGNRGFSLLSVRFIHSLILYLDDNAQLLTDRGEMIITDLCQVLRAEVVYRILSVIIHRVKELKRAVVLVQKLNRILLTQPSLHNFRNQLRAINTVEGCQLLEGLSRAWCHNPVSLLSLFMLTQNYRECNRLIKLFGDLNMNVNTLIEMDQLIQLIESPIFSTLRMHLLDRRYSADLHETLYCLLMCLPQTDAFHALWRRLQCVPPTEALSHWPVLTMKPQPDMELIYSRIPFDDLFDHFHALQKTVVNTAPPTRPTNAVADQRTSTIVPSIQLNDSTVSVGSATDYLSQSLAKYGIHIPDATQCKSSTTNPVKLI